MSDFKLDARVNSISGGIAIGDHAKATGSGGHIVTNQVFGTEISIADLQALIGQIRGSLAEVPADLKDAVQAAIASIEVESNQKKPSQSKIRALLVSLKSVCEGTIGSLVASGIVVLIEKILK